MHSITEENFDLVKTTKKSLVYFWVSWSSICLNMEELEKLESQNSKISFFTINSEENSFLSEKYNIIVNPTYILFVDGKPKEFIIGLKNNNSLQAILDKYP